MDKPIVKYHHNKLPAPKIVIGEPTHIFPAEMMTRDDGVIQRMYGLTKTDDVVAYDATTGSIETNNIIYVLETNK